MSCPIIRKGSFKTNLLKKKINYTENNVKFPFKTNISHLVAISAIFFIAGAAANAQQPQRNDRSIFYDYGESFYSEAHLACFAIAGFVKDICVF